MENNLISDLRELLEWAHGNEWETPITLGDHLDAAADALEAADKRVKELEEAQRWIPVSDRLPERRAPVLVYSPMWVHPVLALCRDDDEFWTGIQAVTPTHWMPLPEMPKEAQS